MLEPGSYFLQFLGSLGFLLVFSSYLFRNILYLRFMSILAAITGSIYFFYAADKPLWTAIFWQFLFISINLLQIIQLFMAGSKINMGLLDKNIYQMAFTKMRISSFKKLLNLGIKEEVSAGTTLLVEGEVVKNLIFIYAGKVDVILGGKKIAECKAGNFIGEMSFETELPATATVITTTTVNYIKWDKLSLRNVTMGDKQIDSELHAAIIFDLIKKIAQYKIYPVPQI